MKRWIRLLKQEMLKPLPGEAAHAIMSPLAHRPPEADVPLRQAGVAILLYEHRRSVHTVFIKRVEYEGVHSGQISFPGGMYEQDDLSLTDTALRETEEETGIPRQLMEVTGMLSCLHIPVSNVDVYPFVVGLPERPVFSPDPAEVEFILEARINDLLNPANIKRTVIHSGDLAIDAPYCDVHGHVVWGATAMILSEFLEICRRIAPQV